MANELGLLTSKRLMPNTIKALDLNVQYNHDNTLLAQPLYDASPIKVEVLRLNETKLRQAINNDDHIFRVRNLGSNGLQLNNEKTKAVINTNFNTPIDLNFIDFLISGTIDAEGLGKGWTELMIKFVTIESIANAYHRALEVEFLDDQSTLIQLKLTDRVPKRAEDILNQLIFEYNRDAIEDKNLIAKIPLILLMNA